jgi:hypothetical protein
MKKMWNKLRIPFSSYYYIHYLLHYALESVYDSEGKYFVVAKEIVYVSVSNIRHSRTVLLFTCLLLLKAKFNSVPAAQCMHGLGILESWIRIVLEA